MEKNTSLRFARTYFMSNLSQKYMHGIRFYQNDDDTGILNEQGRKNEQGVRLLFNAYTALILTFQNVSEIFLKGEIKSQAELSATAFAQFSKILTTRAGQADIQKLLQNGKEDFIASAKSYDAMGNEVDIWSTGLEKKLLILRL